jgi:hypothetical protein
LTTSTGHVASCMMRSARLPMHQTKARTATASRSLSSALPDIALGHADALWVLAQLGFSGKRRASTFHEYIKSLRKLGTPFERGRHEGGRRGRTATYTYFQLMELVLTLTLRVYHVVPDSLLLEIISNRARLHRHYRQAYLKRHTGVGAPIVIKATGHRELHLRGTYLDLQINFSGGRVSNFGPRFGRLRAWRCGCAGVPADKPFVSRRACRVEVIARSRARTWTAAETPLASPENSPA